MQLGRAGGHLPRPGALLLVHGASVVEFRRQTLAPDGRVSGAAWGGQSGRHQLRRVGGGLAFPLAGVPDPERFV